MSLIAINYAQLDVFHAKVLKLGEVMAEIACSPVMNNFKRTLILAISMGYKDYPTMFLSSKARKANQSELFLFQNDEMNNYIAKLYAEESKYLDFEKAKAGLKVLSEWEMNQTENVSSLIEKYNTGNANKPYRSLNLVFKTASKLKNVRGNAMLNQTFDDRKTIA